MNTKRLPPFIFGRSLVLSVFSGCAMITGGKGRTLPAGDQNRLLVKSWLTIVARSTSGCQAAGGSQVNWSCSAG